MADDYTIKNIIDALKEKNKYCANDLKRYQPKTGWSSSLNDYYKSAEYLFLNLKSIYSKIESNATLNSSCEKLKIRINGFQEDDYDKLATQSHRFGLISEIFFCIQNALWPANSSGHNGYRLKLCHGTCSKTADCFLELRQASFIVLKKVRPKVFEERPCYPDIWNASVEHFGWRSDNKEVNNKLETKGINSLCHFPTFFLNPESSVILICSIDHQYIRAFGRMFDNFAEFITYTKDYAKSDTDAQVFLNYGLIPFMLSELASIENNKFHIHIWLGVSPKTTDGAHSTQYYDNRDLLAMFLEVVVPNNDTFNAPKTVEKLFEQQHILRYLMLDAFAMELQQELEVKNEIVERQRKQFAIKANEYDKIRDRLNGLIRLTNSAHDEATDIMSIINPSARFIFELQKEIENMFSEDKLFEFGTEQIRANHGVSQIKKDVRVKYFAKILCMLTSTILDFNNYKEQIIKILEKLKNDLESQDRDVKRRAYLLIKLFITKEELLGKSPSDLAGTFPDKIDDKSDSFISSSLEAIKFHLHTMYKVHSITDKDEDAILLASVLAFMPEEVSIAHAQTIKPKLFEGQLIAFVYRGHLIDTLEYIISRHVFDNQPEKLELSVQKDNNCGVLTIKSSATFITNPENLNNGISAYMNRGEAIETSTTGNMVEAFAPIITSITKANYKYTIKLASKKYDGESNKYALMWNGCYGEREIHAGIMFNNNIMTIQMGFYAIQGW